MSRNISNCEVGWPRAGEGNQRIPQGTALGCGELRMSKMETPSLTPLRHFFSLSPEIQPWFLAPYLWTFIYSGNKISFCWPGCFVSPLWIFPSLLIQEKGTSSIPKLSGTAGIALQTPTDTFGSSFGFVFRAWLLLQLELQKHHMHWEKEKKKKIPAPCSQCFLPQARSSACPDLLSKQFLEWKLGNHPSESIPRLWVLGITQQLPVFQEY